MAVAPPPPDWSMQDRLATPANGRPVGFWMRVIASLIDWIILASMSAMLIGAIAGIAAAFGKSSRDVATAIGVGFGIVAAVVGSWLYEALMTSSERGATLGKWAIGARIVRADGQRLTFGRATTRYLLKGMITPMVPLGIGFMLAGWTKGKRALHDLMADTLVIRPN